VLRTWIINRNNLISVEFSFLIHSKGSSNDVFHFVLLLQRSFSSKFSFLLGPHLNIPYSGHFQLFDCVASSLSETSYRNGVPHKGTWIAPDFTYEGEFKFCSSTSVTRGVSKEKRHSITANDDLPPQLLPPPEIHPCYLFDGIGSLVRRAPHGGVIAYEGEFHKGRMHGVGREKMPDGSLYAGEFLNGYRHGVGTLFEINLETYQSENKTDDGSDKYTREKENTKDLSCFSGVWSHGKLVGKDEGNEVEQNWATSIKWSGKCVDAFDKS